MKQKVTVTLSGDIVDYCKHLGNGNLSLGLEKGIERAKTIDMMSHQYGGNV